MTRVIAAVVLGSALLMGAVPPGAQASVSTGSGAPSIEIFGRDGKFPDGRTYHALMGPNQGSRVAIPECTPPCYPTALLYGFGWVQDTVHAYNLFWQPTSYDGSYNGWMSSYFTNSNQYGPGYRNTLTQYFQQDCSGCTKYYITNAAYVYSNQADYYAYSNYRPNHPNWIEDQDIVSEIKRVGVGSGDYHDAQIHVFLQSGEQVCSDSNGSPYNCFPGSGGCGYHSAFTSGDGHQYAYSVEPYGGQSGCKSSPCPNSCAIDTGLTVLSHESFEMLTDPAPLSGWRDQQQQEIGDKCAWQWGPLSYDGGKANHSWGTSYYLVQMEWSNHNPNDPYAGYCIQYGI